VIIFLLVAGAALILAQHARKGWRDRPPGRTVWLLLDAGILSAVPVAAFGRSGLLTYGWLVLVVGAGAAAGAVLALRGRRERRQAMALAISTGLPPAMARVLNRPPRATPATLIRTYVVGTLAWVLAIRGVETLVGKAFFSHPEARLDLGASDPLLLPWWVVAALALLTVGSVHAAFRHLRRTNVRALRRTASRGDVRH